MPTLDEFYPLIGKVVVEFQSLDFQLNILFACLLREDPNVSMAFAVTLPFSKKIDVLKSIAPFKIPQGDLHLDLEKIIILLTQSEEKRNQVIHASWIPNASADKVFFHKPRATRKEGMKNGGIRESMPSEIDETLQTIHNAKQGLFAFCARLQKSGILRSQMISKSD